MRPRAVLNPAQQAAIVSALVGGATAVAWLASNWLSTDNLALIFLVAVTIAGGYIGLRAAVFASIVSFLAYNFLFTEPRFTLLVARTDDVVSLVVFLLASFVVGELAARLREQAEEAHRNAERVTTLLDFSQRIAVADSESALAAEAGSGIGEVMKRQSAVFVPDVTGALTAADGGHQAALDADDLAAARWAFDNEAAAGRGTATHFTSRWHFEPVTSSERTLGTIGILSDAGGQALDDEEERLLAALRAQLGLAWERLRLQQRATDARVEQISSQLRSALLASVSHDLRTPLVSIIGALTALQDLDARLSAEDRTGLARTALEEAQRLNRFVQNLLDMTRLSYGAFRPKRETVSVTEAIEEARRRLASALSGRDIQVQVSPQHLTVRADRTLLEQVLVNLLDNAAKYSAAGESVAIDAHVEEGRVVIMITDRGIGIAPEDRSRVFDVFYRARHRDHGVVGQGLGLPICRGFVEAMSGRIDAKAGPDGEGTSMCITLPAVQETAGHGTKA